MQWLFLKHPVNHWRIKDGNREVELIREFFITPYLEQGVWDTYISAKKLPVGARIENHPKLEVVSPNWLKTFFTSLCLTSFELANSNKNTLAPPNHVKTDITALTVLISVAVLDNYSNVSSTSLPPPPPHHHQLGDVITRGSYDSTSST